MLKKRLVGVITVRDGHAVQSFGYRRWLPLGRPEVLAQNLDRWGADEILLQCIDRSRAKSGPDFALLERIGKAGLSTPLIYAGGIATPEQATAVVQAAADRVVVDALLHDDLGAVQRVSAHLGAQAVIAALPLSKEGGALRWLDHRSGERKPLPDALLAMLRDGVISETLVVDWRHEGQPGGFDDTLVNDFPVPDVPLIAFGGLSEPVQWRSLLRTPRVVAVGIGNFLAYREHAVQHVKQQLGGITLRPPVYVGTEAA
jgi:imidazole glycerol-phosphate synthase subunit HisF